MKRRPQRPHVLGIPIPPAILRGLAPILADCAARGVSLVAAVDEARERQAWVVEHAEPVAVSP